MIRVCLLTKDGEIKYDVPLKEVKKPYVRWYWVDFDSPSEEEEKLLSSFFRFHPLAIEDCIGEQQERPKVDFYDRYLFFLVHAIEQETLDTREVNFFVTNKMLVTFHKKRVRELNNIWNRIRKTETLRQGPYIIFHHIIDKFVDDYFPHVYNIEERLNLVDDNPEGKSINDMVDELFDIRHDLSKIRRTIIPMRDLLYRILNSERLSFMKERQIYFHDVYDHLLKLVEMLETARDFSSDIRDNYLSINSDKMNNIMMTLTIITTIFMPLTFIAGVYGMNFAYMPELNYRYGYYIVLAIMAFIALVMFMLFIKAGWLRIGKKK
ncbi:MAG TPA: magnesium/cobalt transporter CorA [Chondromyces sp.]|nr:magnesium/cobalt transporter CorA [Chondromyces sp.]